jgi:hypothetical protein
VRRATSKETPQEEALARLEGGRCTIQFHANSAQHVAGAYPTAK